MNDYIAKPIDVRSCSRRLARWVKVSNPQAPAVPRRRWRKRCP